MAQKGLGEMVDREAICDARIAGGTLEQIAKAYNISRLAVRKILVMEDIFDEQDDKFSPARTARMCAGHLADLVKVYGEGARQ